MNEELIRLIDDSVKKAEIAEDALRAGAPVDGPETRAAREAIRAVNAHVAEHGIDGEDAELIELAFPPRKPGMSRDALVSFAVTGALVLAVFGLIPWLWWWLA